MGNLLFLIVPAVLAAIAVTVVWLRNRPETSPTSGIDRFSEQMAALAPERAGDATGVQVLTPDGPGTDDSGTDGPGTDGSDPADPAASGTATVEAGPGGVVAGGSTDELLGGSTDDVLDESQSGGGA
jgi:hypothetical protein